MVLVPISSGADVAPANLSSNESEELSIYYTHGACHAEWGRTNIWIDATGKGLYESGSGYRIVFDGEERFENQYFRKTFFLNETELRNLGDELERTGFYSLNDSYENPEVRDGSCETLWISKNNITKTVHVVNAYAPEAYHRAATLIEGVAKNKTHPIRTWSMNLESLLGAIKNGDSDLRASAASALGHYEDDRAVDALIEAASDEDSYVRWKAVEALGNLNDSRAVEQLILALQDENEWVREYAAMALGNLRDPRAVDPLIQALYDNDSLVRYYAVDALADLKDPRAVEPIMGALHDEDSSVRERAINALGELNDTRAIDPLTQILNDENEMMYIRDYAADALKKLGCQ